MLELRPTCEHCNKTLPPNSLEARICTYECTFCATVLIRSWAMSVRTAVVGLCPDPSDRRRTGKAIIILVKTRRVPKLSTDRLTQKLMRDSLPKSGQYHPKSGNLGQ
jgi:hypothetical protein